MSRTPDELLTRLLRDVSRSFYLTLRVLPAAVRPQISLAYLLARATDTIADTEIVPLTERGTALDVLRARILGTSSAPLNFGALAGRQGSIAEQVLLERCEEALAVLNGFQPVDQQRIRDVLQIITSGQELDMTRFAGASEKNIVALNTDDELDDYTYRVAGCVGEFWTKICRAHVFPTAPLDDAALLVDGVRFGKGLQLVNILRDLPKDLRQGRCYLPAERLRGVNLTAADLLEPANAAKFQPVYDHFLALAQTHLTAGWAYTNALPRGSVRVRLACAWPILIGMETLKKLRTTNVLDPRQRIKINRVEIRRIMVRSLLYYPWPGAWANLLSKG